MKKLATFTMFMVLGVSCLSFFTEDKVPATSSTNYSTCMHSDNTKFQVSNYQKQHPQLSYNQIAHILCK